MDPCNVDVVDFNGGNNIHNWIPRSNLECPIDIDYKIILAMLRNRLHGCLNVKMF